MTGGTIRHLYVYPIKGLSPQPIDSVDVQPERGFPGDRLWALARAGGGYRRGTSSPVPKSEFHVLVSDARLAGLTTHLTGTSSLSISVQGHVVLEADLALPEDQERVSGFFGRVLDLDPRKSPVIAREQGRRFTDVSVVSDSMMNAVSFINLESVRELERRTGTTIDPLRFRANIYYDGMAPFSELDLVGRSLRVGSARFDAVLNTKRCAATEVNPRDARRDLPVPRLLVQHLGHDQMGVYAEVRAAGTVTAGSAIEYSAAPA